MKKKKPSMNPFDQFSSIPKNQKTIEKIFKELTKPFSESPSSTDKYNDYDNYSNQIEKLDAWCEKWLDKNPKAVSIKENYYLYKDYTRIDELLRKYGKELIKELILICPLKGRAVKHDMYDCLAFAIYRKRIDPKSLIEIPEYKPLWDKISDHGHA